MKKSTSKYKFLAPAVAAVLVVIIGALVLSRGDDKPKTESGTSGASTASTVAEEDAKNNQVSKTNPPIDYAKVCTDGKAITGAPKLDKNSEYPLKAFLADPETSSTWTTTYLGDKLQARTDYSSSAQAVFCVKMVVKEKVGMCKYTIQVPKMIEVQPTAPQPEADTTEATPIVPPITPQTSTMEDKEIEVERLAAEYKAVLYEASTGKELKSGDLGSKDECPERSLAGFFTETTKVYSPINVDSFSSFIEGL